MQTKKIIICLIIKSHESRNIKNQQNHDNASSIFFSQSLLPKKEKTNGWDFFIFGLLMCTRQVIHCYSKKIACVLLNLFSSFFATLTVIETFVMIQQGMVTLTLTAWVPTLRPPPCPYNYQKDQSFQADQLGLCQKPNGSQIGFLVLSLGLLCIGTAGIRPCSLPFGVDQFDHTTEEGRSGINSYYNWYYATFSVIVMLTLTVVVYIQDSVSWIIGFGIPTFLMFCSIILFFLGRHLYIYVKPQGSVFSSIFRVFVAAYNKRRLPLPALHTPKEGIFYDPLPSGDRDTKLALTTQFR